MPLDKKTVIIGATTNTSRYAFMAAQKLSVSGYSIVPLGIREGEIFGEPILNIRESPKLKDVHTVTMYMSPIKQREYHDYILSLSPKRIIFNPGAENLELAKLASIKNIEVLEACTLVLLSTNSY